MFFKPLARHTCLRRYVNAIGTTTTQRQWFATFFKRSPAPTATAIVTAQPFTLSSQFVDEFKTRTAPFGYNGLGELVFRRTYSRPLADGSGTEQWYQTVERVVNGTFNMQRRWMQQQQLGWDSVFAQKSAQDMFARIFSMKFLPPGRGLWAMGSPLTEDRMSFAALNNCAFVSTRDVRHEGSQPFCFLFDAALLGVGVGFDTLGAGTMTVKLPGLPFTAPYAVPDSREGWVESVRLLLDAYFCGTPLPTFDYSHVRPAGAPIKGFGGLAAGPGPLRTLHADIHAVLMPLINLPLSVTAIVDLMNLIGRCVVCGSRQTAEIAFGDPDSKEYVDLKNYAVNPHRAGYGWTSNNSVFARVGMDYTDVCSRIAQNGEPGFAWLENMQAFGRMSEPANHKDARAMGGNPCLEQTLESYELCCLVETFPANHESLEDYKRTLESAYLYAKTVTLGSTHWPLTNQVLLRNRRIGCSMSGVAQFVAARGIHALKTWCEEGYNLIQHCDKTYSDWLAVPRSIKTTCIKPSGTVSLLAGATPGIHFPEARYYIRRVRLSVHSELLPSLREAGYHIEPDAVDATNKVVVSFPVDIGKGVRTTKDVSMWEQLSLAAFMQRYWADNQVSCTVTFDPATEGPQLPHALQSFQYQLKGISFLPKQPLGAYAQMPYEEITETQYVALTRNLRPLSAVLASKNISGNDGTVPDKFCDAAGVCEVNSA